MSANPKHIATRGESIGKMLLRKCSAHCALYGYGTEYEKLRRVFEMNGITVLIIVIDALRQDHCGCYGYGRNTTPTMDAFAKEAIRLYSVTPQSSWTRPSVASLLTSLYPEDHGVFGMQDLLRGGIDSLPLALKRAGFLTAAWIANPNVGKRFGFDLHFGPFAEFGTDDNWLVDSFVKDIMRGDIGDANLFAYVHLFGPHDPYSTWNPRRAEFVDKENVRKIDEYDAAIRNADDNLCKILACVQEFRDWNKTMVIVTADHGEAFFEHGLFGHGNTLFDEEIRIPFLMKLPKACGMTVSHPRGTFELRDVPATVLEAIGLPIPETIQGTSMFTSPMYAPGPSYSVLKRGPFNLEAAMTAHAKLIRDNRLGVTNLFDRASEFVPVREHDPVGPYLQTVIDARTTNCVTDRVTLDDDAKRELAAIGYLGE